MRSLREQLAPLATGTQKACLRKRRYWTRSGAERVRALREPVEGVPLYAYECPHCGGWHLSRMDPAGGTWTPGSGTGGTG